MATLKCVILPHQKRSDGTYNIKIRVTHKRSVKYISSPWYVTKDDLTRTLKLKNQKFIDAVNFLIQDYRKICNDAGPLLDLMSVNDVIEMLKSGGKVQQEAPAVAPIVTREFDLDIVSYTRQYINKLIDSGRKGTSTAYRAAINSLVDFAGKESVSIFELTPKFLTAWIKWIGERPPRGNRQKGDRAPSLYIASLRAMYNRAKREFNDEESGAEHIPFYPFNKIHIPRASMSRKRAIDLEQLRALSALPDRPILQPGVNRFNFARDVFMLSFYLVGMNAVDLYNVTDCRNGRLTYQRAKTRSRRADRAEISIRIEPEAEALVEKYRDPTGQRVFNFYRLYTSMDTFCASLNSGLKRIGAIIGVDDLEFYAARHSWATIAVNDAHIDKYTVHEALNHVDPAMKVTDIYIKKDWGNIDRANRAVIDLVFPPS